MKSKKPIQEARLNFVLSYNDNRIQRYFVLSHQSPSKEHVGLTTQRVFMFGYSTHWESVKVHAELVGCTLMMLTRSKVHHVGWQV